MPAEWQTWRTDLDNAKSVVRDNKTRLRQLYTRRDGLQKSLDEVQAQINVVAPDLEAALNALTALQDDTDG